MRIVTGILMVSCAVCLASAGELIPDESTLGQVGFYMMGMLGIMTGFSALIALGEKGL